jgi:murein DD-endopeptidase MepM/ murein hydrolase activator NlpD
MLTTHRPLQRALGAFAFVLVGSWVMTLPAHTSRPNLPAAVESQNMTGVVDWFNLRASTPPDPVPQVLGTYPVAGQILTVTELGPMNFQTSRITSCGQGVLYKTHIDGTLWVNLNRGIGDWKSVTAEPRGTKIACDREHLYALNTNGLLYHATTRANGQLKDINPDGRPQFWSASYDGKTLAVPAGTNEIQGGMGNIYALVIDSSTKESTLYSSQLRQATSRPGFAQGSADSWVALADKLGTDLTAGVGSKAMYTEKTTSLAYRKANRAFGANPNDSLYYNDTLLYGQNNWTQFPHAQLVILSITADDSNTMYALTLDNNNKHLVRFSFLEDNCTDGLDNDANGQVDAEDGVCRGKLATTWCRNHTRSTCINRIENTDGYSHALVTCSSDGQQPRVQEGLCIRSASGPDHLAQARAIEEPSGSGHYCNVINPDGSWDFDYEGATPCATLKRRHPLSTIVRAGIYSTTGLNNVHVRCSNGEVTLPEGIGTAPLLSHYNAVGHTKNRCVFTVSPKEMRVFDAPFPTSAWAGPLQGGRGYRVGHVFDHIPRCQENDPDCPCEARDCPLLLSPFGNGENRRTIRLDNRGRETSADYENENSYDYVLSEGTPLRSLGYGIVVSSRDRDLSSMGNDGTTYQSEIYIRYDVGSDPTYAESFIAYYAHVGKRVVVTGQTVGPGQLIGYVGTTGQSSEPHLHFGIKRLSNTNGRTTAAGDEFGYHIRFEVVTTNDHGYTLWARPGAIDPYGWRAGDIDPAAYHWSRADSGFGGVFGIGAWSPQMWKRGEVPPYPPK